MVKYKVKQEDLIKLIKNYPIEIVQKMIDHQIEQTGSYNIKELQLFPINAFTWNRTPEGGDFWHNIIDRHNFDVFFIKYPKQKPPMYKGDSERGPEIIDILIELGGEYKNNMSGNNPRYYYYISPSNVIHYSDDFELLKLNYELQELPEKSIEFTLKQFDVMIVKDPYNSCWYPKVFCSYNKSKKTFFDGLHEWSIVIPLNEKTKHLIATNKQPSETYKFIKQIY